MIRKMLLPVLLAGLTATAARADWHEGSSKHFLVYADDSPDNVKAMTAGLERFDKALRTVLKLRDREVGPNARVIVFVLADTGEVQKMVGDRSGNVAGYYVSRSPAGPFAFVPKHGAAESGTSLTPRQVLQHEYTHHVMYSSWGDVVFPTWFSEGFAELFATARIKPDGGIIIGAVPEYRSYGIDRMNDVPVERLVRGAPNYRNGEETQIFYGRSWLLTHYLMFDGDRAKQLAAYIGAINEGKSPAEANKLIGIAPALDLTLNQYVKRPTLPSAALTAAQLPIEEIRVRALTEGESATIRVRMRSHNGVDAKLAQQVVVQARAAAAPYPGDAGAQNELAEAEYDAGNYAACEAAADRALAADAQSVHAMIYKGMAKLAIAKAAGNTDPAIWSAARRWFLAANKADPLYSYPIQLLYESYATAQQPPSRGAKDGLLYAYQLSPQNLALRFEAARLLVDDGKLKAARVAIEPVAFDERGGKIADVAKKELDAIDNGDTAAALAALALPTTDDKPDEPAKKKN
jgi:hypothetical protein